MNIGILGTGHIGKTLARKLAEAGHNVKVANSRGPETIELDVLAFGAREVTTAEAVQDMDVVIVTGTNSHNAVHIAKRGAEKAGARVWILKSCGVGTARALLTEIAASSAAA